MFAHREIKYNNILDVIGNTPMIKINHLNPNPNVTIWAKVEGFNPTGSIKDRIALKMVEQAEKEGKLSKDRIILEATSGNTGIGLAMIGAVKGYKVEIVMSKAVSIERRRMIQAFGANIILTDEKLGTDGAIYKAHEMVEKNPDKYFMPDQFSNEFNKLAHYKTTGEEIWEQAGGKIDYFVSSLGTSGTIMGVGMALKERHPDIHIACAQPVNGHYIQGLKNMEEAIVPAIYDPTKITEQIMVDSEDAFALAREIVRKEGIFVGMSSGAALFAAHDVARKAKSGTIVVIFPDRGEKYLSTDLYKLVDE
jgi:cysteine synthase B